MSRFKVALLVGACAGAAGLSPPAQASDPGRWATKRVSVMPPEYLQGVTSDLAGSFFFDGAWNGVFRTGSTLAENGRRARIVPSAIRRGQGYNHIGDISWDAAEGGRLLLPVKCFQNRKEPLSNCKTSSIAVADPATLEWRYHVELDPAYAGRIRWVEASPDGSLLWTSAGADLIAYRASDVSPANAAPRGPRIAPAVRLAGARASLPAVSGAAFYGARLILVGNRHTSFQAWSIDPATGFRRLEADRSIVGKSKGLDSAAAFGGALHWQIQPKRIDSWPPTFGAGYTALMTLAPTLRYDSPGRCAWIRDGTAARDRIRGTAAGDRIGGRAGNDRLLGMLRDDCLSGGSGHDRLDGGPGNDRVFGGAGRDRLRGGPGRDRIVGGTGSDAVHAVDGHRDLIRCGPGRDRARADRVDRLSRCERVRRVRR